MVSKTEGGKYRTDTVCLLACLWLFTDTHTGVELCVIEIQKTQRALPVPQVCVPVSNPLPTPSPPPPLLSCMWGVVSELVGLSWVGLGSEVNPGWLVCACPDSISISGELSRPSGA